MWRHSLKLASYFDQFKLVVKETRVEVERKRKRKAFKYFNSFSVWLWWNCSDSNHRCFFVPQINCHINKNIHVQTGIISLVAVRICSPVKMMNACRLIWSTCSKIGLYQAEILAYRLYIAWERFYEFVAITYNLLQLSEIYCNYQKSTAAMQDSAQEMDYSKE